MKKQIIFLFIFLFISMDCIAWDIEDSMNAHEVINGAAVSYFSNNFKNNGESLDDETKYLGIAWHVGSNKSITQRNEGVERTETFTDWIKIGGVDADINSRSSETIYGIAIEKPLRHFYDPLKTPTYLTDFSPSAKDKIVNPKMNHITWALTELTHRWSFYQGLLLYKAAMENIAEKDLPAPIADSSWYLPRKEIETPIITVPVHYNVVVAEVSLREYLFAASFRALGETLHCAADLCVPAHVRDDSHGWWKSAGGIGFIEYTVGFDMAKRILQQNSNMLGNDFLNKRYSVEKILKGCALFTNRSFFSKDTICNNDPHIKPTTYNQKIYDNPSFENTNLEFTTDDERLYHTFGSKRVILLIRKWSDHWSKTAPKIEYLVPPEAAEGQASVLLPLAAAAGGEIIDRFLPTMKLGLTVEKDNNSGFKLIGSLTHEIEKDIEWQNIGEIKYNGTGEIQVNGTSIATATFINGQMTASATFNDKDKVQLIVKAGALIHKSNIVEVSVKEAIPPKLICSKKPEFTQFLKEIGADDSSCRIGYVRTKSPKIMATVQALNVDYILINWWFDGAPGTIVHEYFYGWRDFPTETMPYHDIEFFEQYGRISKDLETLPRFSDGISYCVPAGINTFHIEGYYAEGYTKNSSIGESYPPSGLLGQPGKYKTISLEVPFEVQALSSPAKQYQYADGFGPVQREISFSKIEQNTNETKAGLRTPAWVPTTWLMSFKFDGPYTYYFQPSNNPDRKIAGFYKEGIPSGHWIVHHFDDRWEFDCDKDGQIKSGVLKYDSDTLVRKYTASDYTKPSFLITHDHLKDASSLVVKKAQIETFGDPKEIYHVVDGYIKEGPYSYVKSSDLKTVTGFYSNGMPTGKWEITSSEYKWNFEFDEEGSVLSGIKKYDSNDKLVAQYTANASVNPSFEAFFSESRLAIVAVTIAYVETFSDSIEEKYYIVNDLREGAYSSVESNGKKATGQYANGQKTGTWTYYNPNRIPPEYTQTY